ncbi:hypothetical protein [Nocardia sp. NPDC051832]|uniref:hypothetical protein n=1 Tax=Nocardia sp. NPDC051832 TaxID=3155673 RepID=UPI00341E257A
MSNQFWLLDWMDSCGIERPLDLAKAVGDRARFRELCEKAESDCDNRGEDPRTNNPVVAGRGVDLSGELIGASGTDLITEVDTVFGMTWHYFDEIIVEGLAARRFTRMIDNADYRLARRRVISHGRLLMHLRRIGALDSVVFRQKPDPCITHGSDGSVLEGAGLNRIMDDRESIVQVLADGKLHQVREECAFHLLYRYEHPLVGIRTGVVEKPRAGATETQLKVSIAESIFGLFATYASADAASAAELSAPLAVASPILESILSSGSSSRGVQSTGVAGSVAIEIGLPVLYGVSAADLLKIRQDEADSFERFRKALRTAINEAIDDPDRFVGSSAAAAVIVDETIVPALHDIDQRLSVAGKAMVKKSGANVTVGVALAIVGLISGIPLLLPAGIALGTGVPGVHMARYLDQKGEIELSDMYFLWKLQNTQAARGSTKSSPRMI